MKIGIDIDDVLIDFCYPFAEFHNQTYGTNWDKDDLNTYRLEDLTGDTWDEMQLKMDKFVKNTDFFNKKISPEIKKSLEMINQDHEVYLITGRPDHYREGTLCWAKNNLGGLYKDVFFVYGNIEKVDKWEFCVNHGIEVMIEDLPEFALKCRDAGIKVLLFDHPWNQGIKGKNICRVKSWSDILQYFVKSSGVRA